MVISGDLSRANRQMVINCDLARNNGDIISIQWWYRATCMGWWFCNSGFVSCWKLSWVVFNLISGEVINTRLEGLKPYDQRQKWQDVFCFFFTCSTIEMGWCTTKGKLIWDWLERPVSVSRSYWYGFDDASWLMTDLCNDDWHVKFTHTWSKRIV